LSKKRTKKGHFFVGIAAHRLSNSALLAVTESLSFVCTILTKREIQNLILTVTDLASTAGCRNISNFVLWNF